jgi:hypothetical protein
MLLNDICNDAMQVALEPHGGMKARLHREAELGCDHWRETTWQHGSSPVLGGRIGVQPWAQSHVAAWEPISVGRLSHGRCHGSEAHVSTGAASTVRQSQSATTCVEPRGSMGANLCGKAEQRDCAEPHGSTRACLCGEAEPRESPSLQSHVATWEPLRGGGATCQYRSMPLR